MQQFELHEGVVVLETETLSVPGRVHRLSRFSSFYVFLDELGGAKLYARDQNGTFLILCGPREELDRLADVLAATGAIDQRPMDLPSALACFATTGARLELAATLGLLVALVVFGVSFAQRPFEDAQLRVVLLSPVAILILTTTYLAPRILKRHLDAAASARGLRRWTPPS